MENNFFRREAMSEATSPDELDQIIKVTNRRSNLLVLGLSVFVIASLLWGFYGSVPVTIKGSGIIMPGGGVHYVISQHQGVVRSILVESGHYIRMGEPIGNIEITDEDGNSRMVQIKASINGRVSEVRSLPGDFVYSDERIISVVAASEDQDTLEAILFVPIEQGKSLEPGLAVHIQPTNVNKEEYGFIKGVVKQVSSYPVSRQRMLALLGTEALVSRFSDGKVVLEVEVELILSDLTVSGYQWSTPNGPPFNIYEGTLCNADFIIETKKPIHLVIPRLCLISQ
ncbi:HlyD family efflux transporter periplasmic adaptor subunit [Alkaliphilus peptidifermentans]|uniref:NHLM bacteriocin system secretion protein n=1 Tax=Alkaliphilus peptidifermentans DSM 18978 TaxID=1120976 RepID=A0A1G5EW20_9FIRM|nr:HlyD family efflux transporter periplasmic adaptor subunit [Alkaliphilus peptidifermentans]SCY30840.1 NHLM bacteriocin system secretion protein [Alkaliphilus peptidifermentans DSM 18978]